MTFWKREEGLEVELGNSDAKYFASVAVTDEENFWDTCINPGKEVLLARGWKKITKKEARRLAEKAGVVLDED